MSDDELIDRCAQAAFKTWGHTKDWPDVWRDVVRAVLAEAGRSEEAPDYPFSREMRALLGKNVEVVLARDPKLVTMTGVLCMFSDDGEVGLRQDDWSFRWCWPNLECREVPPEPATPNDLQVAPNLAATAAPKMGLDDE